jgi:hypothetical protein
LFALDVNSDLITGGSSPSKNRSYEPDDYQNNGNDQQNMDQSAPTKNEKT